MYCQMCFSATLWHVQFSSFEMLINTLDIIILAPSVPTSVVTVNESPFPAYNGTVYNLTGILQLDTAIVDTGVNVMWEWSLNSQVSLRQSTSAVPHMITIPFNPLAMDDSGLYSLNLNIQPINPQYVIGNSDSSTTHSLTILSEFWS